MAEEAIADHYICGVQYEQVWGHDGSTVVLEGAPVEGQVLGILHRDAYAACRAATGVAKKLGVDELAVKGLCEVANGH